ncbi:hypothetical protein ILUMI_21154 [Ignelater luminosus]|uniref:RNA 3'-terminal phosphate cyclase-like protein n=1 Tax=Ignelater luminosus TaxID=2038154 RepID=A0A8K0CD09_IGNLU|nr:hypothetical protein ILUMI_21154 [Ignelater luminosus]
MSGTVIGNNTLLYKGSSCMRQRLILSVLSGKPIKIIDIRSYHDVPGLQDFEINLIRLLDKVTNGTVIELNETGTELYFQPGLLHGGAFEHDCSLQRGIGYYLEVLVMLGPFCKVPLNVILRGVTSNSIDPSVDHVMTAFLPTVKKFIVDDDVSVKVLKRGMLPLGGGEIVFRCPVRRHLRPIQLLDGGMVKRIRGIAYALRVSPAIANRMVDSAKGVLLKFIPDVYINTDQRKGNQSGKSPGFGLHLVAETTVGVFYAAEQVSNVASEDEKSTPEDVGTAAANKLLQQIYLGGCVDSAAQSVAALFMALSQKDVSQLVVGPLSEYTITFLQHLREFFGVTFKLEHLIVDDDEDDVGRGSDKIQMTCVGIQYSNLNKRVT